MSTTLEALIERARRHVMTADERREQKISLAMGLRPSASTSTREEIAAAVDLLSGNAANDVAVKKKPR